MERLDGSLRTREAAEFLGVFLDTLRNGGREDKIAEFRHPVNNYRLYRQLAKQEGGMSHAANEEAETERAVAARAGAGRCERPAR